jgi:hypothetical protein
MNPSNPKILGSLLFLSLVFFFCSCSQTVELVSDGKSEHVIFVSKNATAAERTAARKLQSYLQKITGAELPLTDDPGQEEKVIFVGFDGAPADLIQDLNPQHFENEEYIIRGRGKQLLIAGGGPRGTLYGVVGYLSDHLGCRWYTKSIEKIPQQATLTIPKTDDRQKPDFQYREVNWREAYEENWSVHNRMIPSRLALPDSLGGSFVIFPERGHTFDLIIPPAQYFKSNPEYFSEINGVRTADNAQLCLTNPDVLKLTVAKVLEWVKVRPDANVYSVTQNDNVRYCTCHACAAVDKEEGSPAGTLIRFLNKVSENVRKVHPAIKLQTFAYTYTEEPPLHTKVADNLVIELCHYNYCSAHAIGECKDHTPFTTRLEKWKKIAQNVTVWGYYVNFGFYLMPFPNLEAIKKDVKYYKKQQTYGLYAEGCNIIGPQGGGEFSELKSWVFAQLMWNSDLDPEALIDEYLENVYGPAAPSLRSYIDLLQHEVSDSAAYFNIWSSPVEVSYLSHRTVEKADSLFGKAREVAGNDPALLERIEKAYLPLLFTKLYFNAFGAGSYYIPDGAAPELAEKFANAIKQHQITFQGSNESMPDLLNEIIARAKVQETFFKDWWLAGPFDSDPDRKGYEFAFAPEQKVDTNATLRTPEGKELVWKKHQADVFPYIDLAAQLSQKENVVGYAFRTIHSPEPRVTKFGVGSNDGVKVWVNKKLVLNRPVSRRAAPNQDIIAIPLQKGSNEILVKVDQIARGWGFYFSEIRE